MFQLPKLKSTVAFLRKPLSSRSEHIQRDFAWFTPTSAQATSSPEFDKNGSGCAKEEKAPWRSELGVMMSLRHRQNNSRSASHGQSQPSVYNIIPIHDVLADHPSLRSPEVRAAIAALRSVGDLRRPPFVQWRDGMDLLDWLGYFFGFQADNVRNQREHIVLLLSNSQMRLQPPPENPHTLDLGVIRAHCGKVLRNYLSWCSFLGRRSNAWLPGSRRGASTNEPRRDLLYTSLYLLIWGEAANLRFVPECLCYIFHHMAMELNRILEGYVDDATGALALPSFSGENAFLTRIVTPLYETIKAEVDASRNGTAPHTAWRNYDDINEYFWSRHVFDRLRWPMDLSRRFFVRPPERHRVRKTGFVEQRSFWNLFRSFDRLWVMLILFFQAAMLVAWEGGQGMESRDVQVRVLTIFITWAALRLWQSMLDASTQYSLVSRETVWLGVRMVLKTMVAIAWTIVFRILYSRIWEQKNHDRQWSPAANARVIVFLEAAGVFVLPEVLALLLFVIPFIRNFVETKNWGIFYVLTWWYQSRIFVGRGLREGFLSNVKYGLFWILVLISKFSFSYFLQIKPLVAPTKAILKLKHVNYQWHEFFTRTNIFAVVILWLPVILIYLMDTHIWYSIFSAIVGALVGLFSHLGEIRNMQQLRLRFQFFASAMQFNIMPEDQMFEGRRTLRSKFHNAILRLKLRYGLGRPYKKIESNQVNASRFALIWNEIIIAFREEDIISNREVELLELPSPAWDIRVIRWPCLLLCNELLLALNQAKEYVSSDIGHWRKICKSEYRRSAVIEAYDSMKYLLLEIIKKDRIEHSIITKIFSAIDDAIAVGKFTVEFKISVLPNIHTKLMSLLDLLLKPKHDLNKIVNTLQTLYDIAIRDFPKRKRSIEELRQAGWAPLRSSSTGLLFEDAIDLTCMEDSIFYKQVKRFHTIVTSRDSMNNVPKNLEARRRIAFFSNSLFMNMPRAPQVEKMLAFSVLTPYYSEDVSYSKEQLRTPNEDGVSILFYLQKIYDDEWLNFLERMRSDGMVDEKELWSNKVRELRLWASYRGQTLARTIRGMMYYYRALKMLAFLDSANEIDIREGSKRLASIASMRFSGNLDILQESRNSLSSQNLSQNSNGVSLLLKGTEYGTAMMKYTYVVACQIYGSQKAKKDPNAEEILYLMKHNEALRVAYVDEVHTGRDEVEYYSVLVKYDQVLKKEVEIYRIRLPGPLKLGEGKPENQNHALIFTRGDAVQTIDMNQDNYFEEALKVRNLLEEFNCYHGSRKPTLLGVREHVFTGSVSSLAWFMSAQETSFVTLGQRVLANPLKVRMHYGHPDVFDRLWFLSRGGISKASRVINISEDIFAGFNCTLRGGNVTHHEYTQVGKGRDVGLNQISMFEAKVASGNGEQVLSRDVYRLGHRLDFFRMLSFYYSTVGFFFNTMIVILTVYAFAWGRLYLALSGLEDSIMDSVSNNAALGSVLNQQFIIQLGIFTALPMIVENSLEHGFLPAIWDFIIMQLQLSSVFYTFSMGTRSHYFGRTILHGGAKYRATGRGFVVQHKSFVENYRLYARSHFIKAIELGVILTVYAAHGALSKNTFVYIILTLSSWFLIVSWIMAPFVFNPSGFDWLKTVYDFEEFMNWIWYRGGVFTKSEQSWETWWYEEHDHLRTTGLWGKAMEIVLDMRYFFFQYGIVYQLKIANGSTSAIVYLLSWIYVIVAVGIFVVLAYARDKYSAKEHMYYRAVQAFFVVSIALVIVMLLRFTNLAIIDIFTSFLAFLPTGWGIISIAQVMRSYVQASAVWDTVISVARLYDLLFGVIVMAPVAFLAWLPGLQSMQTRILFNDAFSRGLQISRIIAGRKSAV